MVQKVLRVGLSFELSGKRVWVAGHARDYVEGMRAILQQEQPDDYVLAVGETHTVHEFVEAAFGVANTRIAWKGEGIKETGVDAETGRPLVEIDPK